MEWLQKAEASPTFRDHVIIPGVPYEAAKASKRKMNAANGFKKLKSLLSGIMD